MAKHLYVLLFLISTSVFAQNRWSVSTQAEYGFLFLHSQDVAPIGQSYPYGAGIEAAYWLLKEGHWNNCHCYPNIGFSLNYHHYDNPEVLGFGLPVYGYIEPWYRVYKSVFFTLRGGAGYGWFSQPYDAQSNPLNLSYSMPFTPFVVVGTGLGLRLNEHWRAGLQLRYSHASNGGQREPNKGLNYPTVALSVNYSPTEVPLAQKPKKPLSEMDKQRSISLSPFVAGKAIDASGVTYTVPGLEVKYSQQLGRVSALAGGFEWISNLAYREEIRQLQSEEDHNQLAVLIGHEFLLGNFTFTQLAGVYLYKDYDVKPDWYQRYGLVWYPFGNFFLGTQIKVHGHIAEFLDARMGYRLTL